MKPGLLVTGATGFIGRHVITEFEKTSEIRPFSFLRNSLSEINWQGTSTVLYLAGLAHQSKKIPDTEYFKVNCDQPLQLAKAARNNKLNKFIYLSSIKVYGEGSSTSLNEGSPCFPQDAYGKSKLKAEQALLELANADFKVCIIRTPLVYGPGVKANMENLMKLVYSWPILPFGNIRNKRSMIFVGNLVALIKNCMSSGQTGIYLAADSQPVSTSKLVAEIQSAFGKKPRLISLPLWIQRLITKITPGLGSRLLGSFYLETSETNKQLKFDPPFSFEQGIQAMVKSFR